MAELEPVYGPDGRRAGFVTPGQPWLADLVARFAAAEAAELARRQAVRAGLMPPEPPASRWLITDRD
jgi:hypothetical protein